MLLSLFFFFNDTATTEIYTLSLHDALPISTHVSCEAGCGGRMFTTFYMNPQNLGTFRLGFHSGLPWAYDEEYHFGQGLDRFTGSIQLQHHPVKWFTHRSEERRVGKECRSRWSP